MSHYIPRPVEHEDRALLSCVTAWRLKPAFRPMFHVDCYGRSRGSPRTSTAPETTLSVADTSNGQRRRLSVMSGARPR